MAGRQDSEDESRRILERIARETDPAGASFVARAVKDAHDHVTAADADRSDPIEYWGTRVGRTLGLVLAVGLMIWLVLFITRGS
ncbi:hypothetical protein [Mesorhizobium sp.]|uniref:hypothetical protein n=1 Tax=Mesorhizobium sp. TaxID=1871066 RepID=UPI003BABE7C7